MRGQTKRRTPHDDRGSAGVEAAIAVTSLLLVGFFITLFGSCLGLIGAIVDPGMDLLITLGDLFRQMGLFSDAVIRYRKGDRISAACGQLRRIHS